MGNGEFTNNLKRAVGASINPSSGSGATTIEVLALDGSTVQTLLPVEATRILMTVAADTAGIATLGTTYTMKVVQLVQSTTGSSGTVAVRLLAGDGTTTQTITFNAADDYAWCMYADNKWNIIASSSVTIA